LAHRRPIPIVTTTATITTATIITKVTIRGAGDAEPQSRLRRRCQTAS